MTLSQQPDLFPNAPYPQPVEREFTKSAPRLTDDQLIAEAVDEHGYVGLTTCCDVLGVSDRDSGFVFCRLKSMEDRGLLRRDPNRVGWKVAGHDQIEMALAEGRKVPEGDAR